MAVSAEGLERALTQLADLRTAPVTVEAALRRIVESADDLGREERWPGFSPAAASRGLVAVLASPIPYSMEVRERGRIAVELQGALDSRVVIEQAKGVLVGRHG